MATTVTSVARPRQGGLALFASVVVLLGACPWLTTAVSVDVADGVFVLNEKNYETALKKYPVIMVEFYTPECGHCKELEPKYKKAAKSLRKHFPETGMPRLAKVDATSDEGKPLAEKFNVAGYPTLLVFKDGSLFEEYSGVREKADIVAYMKTFTKPGPLGGILRSYNNLLVTFKEIIRTYTPFGSGVRKFLYTCFPAFLLSPMLCLLFPFICRSKKPTESESEESEANGTKKGKKSESEANGTNGAKSSDDASAEGDTKKKSTRSSSPNPKKEEEDKPADKKKD